MKTARCFADFVAAQGPAAVNSILDALDGMSDRTVQKDMEFQLKALCSVYQELLKKKAEAEKLIENLGIAIGNADTWLANHFCPNLTEMNTCMEFYQGYMEDYVRELNIPEIEARILLLKQRKADMNRCGFKAGWWRKSVAP